MSHVDFSIRLPSSTSTRLANIANTLGASRAALASRMVERCLEEPEWFFKPALDAMTERDSLDEYRHAEAALKAAGIIPEGESIVPGSEPRQ